MNEIYNYIDKSKLSVVLNLLKDAHGLPNECYLEGPYNKIERKKFLKIIGLLLGLQVLYLNQVIQNHLIY